MRSTGDKNDERWMLGTRLKERIESSAPREDWHGLNWQRGSKEWTWRKDDVV